MFRIISKLYLIKQMVSKFAFEHEKFLIPIDIIRLFFEKYFIPEIKIELKRKIKSFLQEENLLDYLKKHVKDFNEESFIENILAEIRYPNFALFSKKYSNQFHIQVTDKGIYTENDDFITFKGLVLEFLSYTIEKTIRKIIKESLDTELDKQFFDYFVIKNKSSNERIINDVKATLLINYFLQYLADLKFLNEKKDINYEKQIDTLKKKLDDYEEKQIDLDKDYSDLIDHYKQNIERLKEEGKTFDEVKKRVQISKENFEGQKLDKKILKALSPTILNRFKRKEIKLHTEHFDKEKITNLVKDISIHQFNEGFNYNQRAEQILNIESKIFNYFQEHFKKASFPKIFAKIIPSDISKTESITEAESVYIVGDKLKNIFTQLDSDKYKFTIIESSADNFIKKFLMPAFRKGEISSYTLKNIYFPYVPFDKNLQEILISHKNLRNDSFYLQLAMQGKNLNFILYKPNLSELFKKLKIEFDKIIAEQKLSKLQQKILESFNILFKDEKYELIDGTTGSFYTDGLTTQEHKKFNNISELINFLADRNLKAITMPSTKQDQFKTLLKSLNTPEYKDIINKLTYELSPQIKQPITTPHQKKLKPKLSPSSEKIPLKSKLPVKIKKKEH